MLTSPVQSRTAPDLSLSILSRGDHGSSAIQSHLTYSDERPYSLTLCRKRRADPHGLIVRLKHGKFRDSLLETASTKLSRARSRCAKAELHDCLEGE